MHPKIFINYRRADEAGFAHAIFHRLEDAFPEAQLFMDVEGDIKPGDEFDKVLHAQVLAADIQLVIIGPRWTAIMAERSLDPNDFVVIEIKSALNSGKRVIPVLVGGAGMPRSEALPAEIRELTRRSAAGLRPERFKADCLGLVAALRDFLSSERDFRNEAEQKAAEDMRREQEDENTARATADRAQELSHSLDGRSEDEVRQAKELANWSLIRNFKNLQPFRDHLARYPDGRTAPEAMARLEKLTWASLADSVDLKALKDFRSEFPDGATKAEVDQRIAILKAKARTVEIQNENTRVETEEWGNIAVTMNMATIERFIEKWPNGQHRAAANKRKQEIATAIGIVSLSFASVWVLFSAIVTLSIPPAFLVIHSWIDSWRFGDIKRVILYGDAASLFLVVMCGVGVIVARRPLVKGPEFLTLVISMTNAAIVFGYRLLPAYNMPVTKDWARIAMLLLIATNTIILTSIWFPTLLRAARLRALNRNS